MSDHQRLYSHEEFALILRKAAELASDAEPPIGPADRLSLAEMKSAAEQAGLDPALVDRAARLLAPAAAASTLERLLGGALRHHQALHLPITLTAQSADRLLSVVRINASMAGSRDVGHSGALGMTWHDGGEMEALAVTARAQGNGTAVSVEVDRIGTLTLVALVSGMGLLLSSLAMMSLYREGLATALGVGATGMVGTLTIARGYWTASTKRWRARINDTIDSISQATEAAEERPRSMTSHAPDRAPQST